MTESPTSTPTTSVTWYFRLSVCCLGLVALAFSQRPGRLVSDTKFDLVVDPGAMLERALHLWDPSGGFGQVQNQAYGYLFPMGAFFWIGDLLSAPGWVVQRLWWSLLLVVAFLGVVALCRALGLGTPTSQVVAGFAYALSPRILTTLGPISIEAWPMALAPWVLLPLVRGSVTGSARRAAALSALAVACVGGVNAAATFAVIPLGVVWLVTRQPGGRRRTLMTWWPVFVLAGTLWWLVPLLLLGRYSPPFLDFIESSAVTTVPTTLFDVLRGTSHWVPYVDPTWQTGNALISTGYIALNSAVLLALGLVGVTLLSNPHRRFLMLGMLLGVVLVSFGHAGAVQGWFAGAEQAALDGVLAPLRNVHKFEPLVRLPLVLGLAHVLAAIAARVRTAGASPVSVRAWLRDGERVAYAGVLLLAGVAVVGVASPALAGRLAPSGDFESVPTYWERSLSWLEAEAAEDAERTTALLVPGSSFATYQWGMPEDEPAQALGTVNWALRNAIPLAPPGNIRMLDAIEARLAAGTPSQGLAAFLRRAGIGHVVVRNDLSASGDRPSPVLVHQALDGSPGLRRVAEFGPEVGGPVRLRARGSKRVVVDDGWHASYRAVEIYEVRGAEDAVLATTPPVVVGGPENILDLLDAGLVEDQPVRLAVDAPEGPADGGLIVTDGLRRREATFARVHDGRSLTLSPSDDGRRGAPARDYLMEGQERWETTVELDGARTVDASGSRAFADTRGAVLPEAAPYFAFDGRVETVYESGAPRSDEHPWVRVVLDGPREVERVTVLAGDSAGDVPQRMVVETETGASEAHSVPDGTSVDFEVPSGTTSWIRVAAAGKTPQELAVAEVRVEGLDLDRTLVLPEVPAAWGAPDHVLLSSTPSRGACVLLDSDVRCAADRARADEDGGVIDRTLRLGEGAAYEVSATARPIAGDALSGLIQRQQLVNVSASSTGVEDARASAVAAVDGTLGTTWLADVEDQTPSLSINWIGDRRVRAVRLSLDRQAPAAAPTRVQLIHPGGRQTVRLDRDGHARVTPFRTSRLEVKVLDSTSGESRTGFADPRPLPVGISEVRIEGVGLLPLDLSEVPTDIGCGFGPTVRVADEIYASTVIASPRQLFDGDEVPVRVCGPSTLELGATSSRVVMTPAPAFRPTRILLSLPGSGASDPVRADATLRMTSPVAGVLAFPAPASKGLAVLRQNANPGWEASTVTGADAAPAVVDGWQQAWWVPQGTDRLELRFVPDRAYRVALGLGGALLLMLLVGVLVWRRGRSTSVALAARVPCWAVPLAGLATLGLASGWWGIGCGLVGGATALLARRWLAAESVAWLAILPIVATSLLYWWRPLGSDDGWAGALVAPQLLVAFALGALVSLELAQGGRMLRSRRTGSSTPR